MMINNIVTELLHIYEHKEYRTNVIYITTKCNFRCEYCFENGKKKDESFINQTCSREEMQSFVDEVYNREWDNNGRCIVVMGGEPFFVFDELCFLFEYIAQKFEGCKCTNIHLFTNGSFFATQNNRNKIKKIIEDYAKRDINIEISISFDGIGQTMRIKKKGYVEKILDDLYKDEIPFSLSYTINLKNYKKCGPDIIKWLKKFNCKIQLNMTLSEINAVKDFNLKEFLVDLKNQLDIYIQLGKIDFWQYDEQCAENYKYSPIRQYQFPNKGKVLYDTSKSKKFDDIIDEK